MKIVLKKFLLFFLLLINTLILQGCNTTVEKHSELDFDFNRYYDKNINLLIEDLELSTEDFISKDANNYNSSLPVAFEGYQGYYNIICDSSNNVNLIEITIPFEDLSNGYEIASNLCYIYKSLENADYLSNEEYRYTDHDFISYKSYEYFQDDISNSESGYFVSHAAWNTDSSVQVGLKIKVLSDEKGSVIVSMMNRDSIYAIKPADISKDDNLSIWQEIESPDGITATVRKDGNMHNLNFDQIGNFLDLLLLVKENHENSLAMDSEETVIASFSISTDTRETYLIALYDSSLVVDEHVFELDNTEKDLFLSFLDTCFYE